MSKCTDCNEYNQEKHYCPKFCDVIRETDKEMREYYKGEHEKLEKLKTMLVYNDAISRSRPYHVLEMVKKILEEE